MFLKLCLPLRPSRPFERVYAIFREISLVRRWTVPKQPRWNLARCRQNYHVYRSPGCKLRGV